MVHLGWMDPVEEDGDVFEALVPSPATSASRAPHQRSRRHSGLVLERELPIKILRPISEDSSNRADASGSADEAASGSTADGTISTAPTTPSTTAASSDSGRPGRLSSSGSAVGLVTRGDRLSMLAEVQDALVRFTIVEKEAAMVKT